MDTGALEQTVGLRPMGNKWLWLIEAAEQLPDAPISPTWRQLSMTVLDNKKCWISSRKKIEL